MSSVPQANVTTEIILGIDPGSRYTGYGVIKAVAGKTEFLDCGTLVVKDEQFSRRVKNIFQGLCEIVVQYQPTKVAIEEVFLRHNFKAALTLGQARGAAISAVVMNGYDEDIPLYEYSARQIKQAIVGRGAADKDQIRYMIRLLLNLPEAPQEDAADALAVALCCANTEYGLRRIPDVKQMSRGRLK